MGELIAALRENGDMIAQAPLAAILWALVIGAVMFAFVRGQKANQIGDLQSRLSLRDDEITDYRRKLEGASPDEARSRIDKLEAELEALKPRQITEGQAEIIKKALMQPGTAQFASDMSCADAPPIAAKLARLFANSGWTVRQTSILAPSFRPPSGLGVTVRDCENMSYQESAVISAFKAAELSFDIQVSKGKSSDAVDVLITTRS